MGIWDWLRRFATKTGPPMPALADWYSVTWDETAVHLDVAPPGRDRWKASFEWATVIRVCFKCEGILASDGIYVFTTGRFESYVIPTEASGGSALWGEILRRGLFDAELAIRAASTPEGLFCWPGENAG